VMAKAKWLNALATVAPVAATMIGGPLAGTAVKSLGSVFGLGESATEADLEKAVLGMTPEQMLQLRKIDSDLEVAMIQADVDLKRIAYDDRASARDYAKATNSKVPAILLIVTASLFAGTICAIFLGMMTSLPAEDKALINYAIGQISGWVGAAVTFYYGSTAGSRNKDELLYDSKKAGR